MDARVAPVGVNGILNHLSGKALALIEPHLHRLKLAQGVVLQETGEAITNVAYGANTSHRDILAALSAATGCSVRAAPHAPTVGFPRIATGRLDRLLGAPKRPLLSMIGPLAAMLAGNCHLQPA